MALLDWSQCPAVESIPGKVSGAWVFKGTRMPVVTVFENLEDGMSIDEVMEQFQTLEAGSICKPTTTSSARRTQPAAPFSGSGLGKARGALRLLQDCRRPPLREGILR